MTGIDAQSGFVGHFGGGNKRSYGFFPVAEKMSGVRACVKFDSVRPHLCGPLYQVGFRAEEQAGAYSM